MKLPTNLVNCTEGNHPGWWHACVVNRAGKDCFFDWIKIDDEENEQGTRRPRAKDRISEDAAHTNRIAIQEGDIAECWWDTSRQLDSWYYRRWYGPDFEEQGYGTSTLLFHTVARMPFTHWAEPGRGGWRFMRRREDKDTPNVDWVAKGVWESILQHVTLEDITSVAQSIGNGASPKRAT